MTHPHTSKDTAPSHHQERLLPRRELRAIVPVSDMTIWRWERSGRFPRHLSVNGRDYWLLSEVRSWIDEQQRSGAMSTGGQTRG